ncbi:MAG: hypothetical protein M1814_004040 [Vezdaea aestivalis]|nr:MAG: hypothetical protein M1814_004040 [Vezdaea aestivalis]
MSSPTSALVGQKPNTQLDSYLLKYLFKGKAPKFSVPQASQGDDRGPALLAGCSIAIFLIILITMTRLCVRHFSKKMKLGLDDYMIIPAALLNIAFLSTIIARVPLAGVGKHLWDVNYVQAAKLFEIGNVSQVLFFAAVTATKISITFFNRRLTGISSKRWRIIHDTFIAILVSFFFISMFINIFQCNPYHFRFNYALRGKYPNGYKCLDPAKLSDIFSIFHAVTVWPKKWSMRKRNFTSLFSSSASRSAGAQQSTPTKSQDEIEWDYSGSTEKVGMQHDEKAPHMYMTQVRDEETGHSLQRS